MRSEITSICAMVANDTLLSGYISTADILDELSACVTLIGSIAVTVTTISIQIYYLIRDRDKDKKNNKPADAENKDKENDKENG